MSGALSQDSAAQFDKDKGPFKAEGHNTLEPSSPSQNAGQAPHNLSKHQRKPADQDMAHHLKGLHAKDYKALLE